MSSTTMEVDSPKPEEEEIHNNNNNNSNIMEKNVVSVHPVSYDSFVIV